MAEDLIMSRNLWIQTPLKDAHSQRLCQGFQLFRIFGTHRNRENDIEPSRRFRHWPLLLPYPSCASMRRMEPPDFSSCSSATSWRFSASSSSSLKERKP